MNNYIQTQYFVKQFYIELCGFEDILENFIVNKSTRTQINVKAGHLIMTDELHTYNIYIIFR